MRIPTLIALLAFMGASSGFAQVNGASASEAYKIEMQLFEDGQVFATPKVTMREGATTIMTVDRPGGYSMRIRLNRARETTAPPQRLTVASEIFLQRGGRWMPVGTPMVMVPLNREARMEIAPSGAGEGFKGTFAMTVLVTPGSLAQTCCGEQACCRESTICNACCCN